MDNEIWKTIEEFNQRREAIAFKVISLAAVLRLYKVLHINSIYHFYSYRRVKAQKKKCRKIVSPFTAFLSHVLCNLQNSALYLTNPPLYENTPAEIPMVIRLPNAIDTFKKLFQLIGDP